MSRMDNVMDESVESSLVSFKKQSHLSVEEAVKLLRSNDLVSVAVPPARPKAGEVYLFRPDKDINVGKQVYNVAI